MKPIKTGEVRSKLFPFKEVSVIASIHNSFVTVYYIASRQNETRYVQDKGSITKRKRGSMNTRVKGKNNV